MLITVTFFLALQYNLFTYQADQTRPWSLFGTPRRTRLDHSYYEKLSDTRTLGTQTDDVTVLPVKQGPIQTPQPLTSSSSETSEEEEKSNIDADYLPSSSSESSSGEETKADVDYEKSRKFLVFEECLLDLLKFCTLCGAPVIETKSFNLGSMIGFTMSCHNGHTVTWRSQPLMNKTPLGNLMISAAVLLSGNTFTKIENFTKTLNLMMFSQSVYNKHQRQNVLPIIQEQRNIEIARAVGKVRAHSGDSLVLSGDGRCDSPGHNAKYGSYALMHGDTAGMAGTRQIVALNLVQVSEVPILLIDFKDKM